jgi:hypothetical protein
MIDLKVLVPAKLHVSSWLSTLVRNNLNKIRFDDAQNPVEIDESNTLLNQRLLSEDELGIANIVGSPSEGLASGRVLIDLAGVAIEVDAYALTLALKPFVKRPR